MRVGPKLAALAIAMAACSKAQSPVELQEKAVGASAGTAVGESERATDHDRWDEAPKAAEPMKEMEPPEAKPLAAAQPALDPGAMDYKPAEPPPPAVTEATTTEKPPSRGEEEEDTKEAPAHAVALSGLARDGTVAAGPEKPTDGKDTAKVRPEHFLPRTFYFQNTYLGGSVSHAERLRQLDQVFAGKSRPYHLAFAEAQPFDAPESSGIELSAAVDQPFFQGPGPVYLQVGLQGSNRFGWRRPPLDAVLVIDEAALADPLAVGLLGAWLDRLEPEDRLAVVAVSGSAPELVSGFGRARDLRGRALAELQKLTPAPRVRTDALARALGRAGALFDDLAGAQATIPGTRALWLVVRGGAEARVTAAREEVHRLALEGVVSSVFELPGVEESPWWQVASAGHGQHHRVEPEGAAAAVKAEVDGLARVVARLLRLNITLGERVHAVRILGSRPLDPGEVRRVKDAEEAMDRRLSETLGVKSDRGEDDEGIQTVIPYFLGGDAHVLVLELWVDGPGMVAEVSLRYKDMVSLGNARAQTRVDLSAAPRAEAPLHAHLRRNVEGLRLAEALATAGYRLRQGDTRGANELLESSNRRAVNDEDKEMTQGFIDLLNAPMAAPAAPAAVIKALDAASEQRQGLMHH